jgi:hypothetical protein
MTSPRSWRFRAAVFASTVATLGSAVPACSPESKGKPTSSPNSSFPSSTTAATADDVRALCASQCGRSTRCPQSGEPPDAGGCTTECNGKLRVLGPNLRADIVKSLASCYDHLACGVNDDGCTTDAYGATGGSVDATVHSPDFQACMQKHDECKGTSGSFIDDHCGELAFLIDSKHTEAARCFERPCTELRACIDPFFGPS